MRRFPWCSTAMLRRTRCSLRSDRICCGAGWRRADGRCRNSEAGYSWSAVGCEDSPGARQQCSAERDAHSDRIAYVVERDGGGQTGAAVTAKPVIPGVRWDAKIPLVLDSNAPPNEMLTYRVYCVDAFGRRSAPASIKIFFPDFHALEPPHPVTAASGAGKIVVSWPAAQKPNLAGYVVERAMLFDGPYEALSAQALPPDTSQYEDDAVQGGAAYYYRVLAVNSRGDLGTPSAAATVQAKNPVGPPKVDGLVADAGQTRVRLTWKPVEFPVAGYFLDRRS